MSKSLQGLYSPLGAPRASPWRHAAAAALRQSSRLLSRLARHLARAGTRPRGDSELVFYAEAGAPEGALYLDGELVGYLPGVTRL